MTGSTDTPIVTADDVEWLRNRIIGFALFEKGEWNGGDAEFDQETEQEKHRGLRIIDRLALLASLSEKV